MQVVTAYHSGNALHIFKEVADAMNLQDGELLSTDRFWLAIRTNAAFGITKCQEKSQ